MIGLMLICGLIIDYWFEKFTHIFCMYIIWKLYKLLEKILLTPMEDIQK